MRSDQCYSCGHCQEEKHIGKSSIGWEFLFRGYYDIDSYKGWLEEFKHPKKNIYDEYGNLISLENFKCIVEDRFDCINHYNVIYGEPQTEGEKEYRVSRTRYYPLDARDHEAWKDNEGYSFNGREFS